jgi:hypothetical protein
MREPVTMVAPLLICLLSSGAEPSEALAQKGKQKGVAACVKYEQALGSDKQSVDLRLSNSCDSVVSCELSWTVKCDGQPAQQREERSFDLAIGEQRTTNASAEACGEAAWHVRNVRWRCASSAP